MATAEEHQVLVRPERPCGTAVLVLAGSSGRVDVDRVRLLARHGALALGLRWFGGSGLQPAPYAIPLETFAAALDGLVAEVDRLAIVGLSFGAEAALLVASRDPRVSAVVAFAPTSVVWAGVGPGPDGTEVQQSHWTTGGAPVPFVPLLDDWQPGTDPPSYRDLYADSLAAYETADPAGAAAATLAVERIPEVVLVAGGDDQVWPSTDFADRIATRRAVHGRSTAVVGHPDAGHRAVLPGEPAVTAGSAMARGGTPDADAELGRRAWPLVRAALDLD